MTIPTIHKLDPAFTVVERLGGKGEVADVLDLDKSTLSRWCQPRPSGTGGMIPQRYWPKLIWMARIKRVAVTVEELASLKV